MKKHDWKESFFDCDGTFEGKKTCVQTWKCKGCGIEVKIPMGNSPYDYQQTNCQTGGRT